MLYQVHFSSDRKRMATVVGDAGRAVALMKGAPEVVLARCGKYLAPDGTVHLLTPAARAEIQAHISTAARDAMRTLAFAHRELPPDFPHDEDGIHARRTEIDGGLTFDGWVGIRDPLRDDVAEARAAVPGRRHRGEDDYRRHARNRPRYRPRDRPARRTGRARAGRTTSSPR